MTIDRNRKVRLQREENARKGVKEEKKLKMENHYPFIPHSPDGPHNR